MTPKNKSPFEDWGFIKGSAANFFTNMAEWGIKRGGECFKNLPKGYVEKLPFLARFCGKAAPIIGNFVQMIDGIYQEKRIADLKIISEQLGEQQSLLEGELQELKVGLKEGQALEINLAKDQSILKEEVEKFQIFNQALEASIQKLECEREALDFLKSAKNEKELLEIVEQVKKVNSEQDAILEKKIDNLSARWEALEGRVAQNEEKLKQHTAELSSLRVEINEEKFKRQAVESKTDKLLHYQKLKSEIKELKKKLDLEYSETILSPQEILIQLNVKDNNVSESQNQGIPLEPNCRWVRQGEDIEGWDTSGKSLGFHLGEIIAQKYQFNSIVDSDFKEKIVNQYLSDLSVFNEIAEELNLKKIEKVTKDNFFAPVTSAFSQTNSNIGTTANSYQELPYLKLIGLSLVGITLTVLAFQFSGFLLAGFALLGTCCLLASLFFTTSWWYWIVIIGILIIFYVAWKLLLAYVNKPKLEVKITNPTPTSFCQCQKTKQGKLKKGASLCSFCAFKPLPKTRTKALVFIALISLIGFVSWASKDYLLNKLPKFDKEANINQERKQQLSSLVKDYERIKSNIRDESIVNVLKEETKLDKKDTHWHFHCCNQIIWLTDAELSRTDYEVNCSLCGRFIDVKNEGKVPSSWCFSTPCLECLKEKK